MELTVSGQPVFAATGGRRFDPALPAIVFIHGAGMDRTLWMQPARWFAHHGWSVLAPDLPGHGRSGGTPLTSIAAMADWIMAMLDAAKVSKAALVGHSMGGAIALEAASCAPDRITRLALVGTAARIPVNPALIETARTKPGAAFDQMTTWSIAPHARIGGNPLPGVTLWGATRSVFGSSPAGALATDLEACNAWTTGSDAAAKVTCPTEVILGDRDIMTATKGGRALAASIPGAHVTVIERCGHMIPGEAPDAFLDALIAALHRPAGQVAA
jgi:pimeloyl-ACP methyl ester carboxylesterase